MTGIFGFIAVVGEVISNLFRPSITVEYPKEQVNPPDGFRGAPEVNPDLCILCRTCERECPTHCITITQHEDEEDSEKGVPHSFEILLAQCMFCQTCEEVCPVGRKGEPAIKLNKHKWRNVVFDTKDSLQQYTVYKKRRKRRKK